MNGPLRPGATLGMLGGGQLGRMSGQAARRLGFRLVVLAETPDAPAAQIADETVVAPLDDPSGYRRMAALCDVLTYEFENVPAEPLLEASALCPVLPRPEVLHRTRHRRREKEAVRALGVPTAEYAVIRSAADLEGALARFGKGVLKRVTGGYDGKGQAVVTAGQPVAGLYAELSAGGRDELLLEAYVPFIREISVIVARSRTGEIRTYPCAENVHRRGILHLSIVPARTSARTRAEASRIAAAIAEGLDLVGVMGIEMFETERGLLVNELAPRPHNSGHFSLDACITSQFEQHVRAVAGWPLGAADQHTPAVMLNLLGEHMPRLYEHLDTILADPLLKLHVYGKHESRPGRKMGHVTALGASVDEALERLERIWPLLRAGDEPLLGAV